MLKQLQEKMHGYTVKNMKTMNGRNGVIWQCKIYKGKDLVVEAFNDGNGGCTDMDYADKNSDLAKEFKQLAESLSEFNFEQDGSFAAELADTQESINRILKQCKASTLIQLKGDGDEEYRVIKQPYSASLGIRIKAHYGESLSNIINEEI